MLSDVLCIKTVSFANFTYFSGLKFSIWAAVTKFHRLSDVQTTEIYFSQSWRLEVQNPGVSRFSIFLVHR